MPASARDGRNLKGIEMNDISPKTDKQRIAKVMARAGLCSRRDAEKWILDGRVKVNGKIIDSPALDVSDKDIIMVDNERLKAKEPTKLWIYHKPQGLVTSHSDPDGRETVFQHIDKSLGRVISVGRLDLNSEGLLLLTNDGELARTLELPATGLSRIYRARAFGEITQDELDKLQKGITVDGVKYGKIEATLERDATRNLWIRVVLHEGKNREIRKVLAAIGLKVNRLIRLSYGPYNLGDLARGAIKEANLHEIAHIFKAKDAPIKQERADKPKSKMRENMKPQERGAKRAAARKETMPNAKKPNPNNKKPRR